MGDAERSATAVDASVAGDALSKQGEFEPFQLISTNLGLFQSGAGLDWLMVYDAGEGAIRAARHEWVHLAQHHTTPALPLWLEEDWRNTGPRSKEAAGRLGWASL